MFTTDLTRRKILSGAMQISVGGAVLLTAAACGDSGSKVALCVDPDKLSSGEKSLRASLHYNAKSPDATKECKGCSFWKVGDKPECGHCDILTGITEGAGHCDSWSARAAG
jgi:hypothetical protein